MEKMELSDILSDKEPQAPEVADPVEKQIAEENQERVVSRRRAHREKEQAAQDAGRPRDAEGKFVAAEKPEATPEPEAPKPEIKPEVKAEEVKPEAKPEFSEKERALLRALEEERRKRQDRERELATLRKPEEKKTFWEDPDAALKEHEERRNLERIQARVEVTEALARQRHTDYDENIREFATLAEQNPALQTMWLRAPDPAEFAYQAGKHQRELREFGGIEQMKERIRAEERVKVEAELKARYEAEGLARQKERDALPGSLSGIPGARQNAVVWSGPTPLADILKN